jgi:DHA1 family chloramphenicol resistance protein-like MFS transporter
LLVYALSLAVFAQGTSEFMLSGLVDPIAAELGVSVAATGWLTSLFAMGMIVGAPLMAVLARRFPPRQSLLAFLAVFLAVHVVGALATGFAVLLVTRVFAALANAGFLAVALAALPSIVGPARTGRATALLLSGVTLACIVGVPGGAVLGQLWGWRAAFWAVVVASLPALAAVALVTAPQSSPVAPVNEWRALSSPVVRCWLLLGALVNGATFATFAYLAPVVTDLARLGDGWVPVALALFGVGSFVGITVAGRLTDSLPRLVIGGGAGLLLLAWGAMSALARWPVALLVLVFVAGALSFGVGSALIGRIVSSAAAAAPRLGGAFATASFNAGAAAGPLLAALLIGLTGSYRSPLLVSAACVAAAGAFALANRRLLTAATAPPATEPPAHHQPSAPAETQ